jgi:PhnB protein
VPARHPVGRAVDAVALGAEVQTLMRCRESPDPPPPGMVPPGSEDKVMHASFRIGESVVMASDDCSSQARPIAGFSLSITVAYAAQARRCFEALADGGQVQMPLTKTFWSPCFGMLADRSGVGWMINATA